MEGAKVRSEDGPTATGYADSQPLIDTMQFYAELCTKHTVTSPGVFDTNLALELFATGRLRRLRHVAALACAAAMAITENVEDFVRGAEAIDAIGGKGSLLQHGLDPWLDAAMLKQDALQVAIGSECGGQAA